MTDQKRRPATRDEKQAAAYLMIHRGDGTPIVSIEEAKQMTAKEIIVAFEKRVDWHHEFEHQLGGTMHPTNLTPLAREDHKKINSKGKIAKANRLSKAHDEFRRKILSPDKGASEPKPVKRKMRGATIPGSKGTPWKKKIGGRTERREQKP